MSGNRRLVLVPAGVLALLGTCFAFYVALVWRWADCHADHYSECSTAGNVQLLLAAVGVAPAAAMLGLAIAGRGRPWRWFLATMSIYFAWALAVSTAIG